VAAPPRKGWSESGAAPSTWSGDAGCG
jgi:hypothetical protein